MAPTARIVSEVGLIEYGGVADLVVQSRLFVGATGYASHGEHDQKSVEGFHGKALIAIANLLGVQTVEYVNDSMWIRLDEIGLMYKRLDPEPWSSLKRMIEDILYDYSRPTESSAAQEVRYEKYLL